MELSDGLFAAFTAEAAPRPEQEQAAGLRKRPRVRISSCLTYALIHQGVIGEPTMLILRDLSRSGISFFSSKPIDAGQAFVVWLRTPGGTPAAVHGAVAWSQSLSRSSYIVGAGFTHIGSEAWPSPADATPSLTA